MRFIVRFRTTSAWIYYWNLFDNIRAMKLRGLKEFIGLLKSHGVEYLVVGAHCLAFQARLRELS